MESSTSFEEILKWWLKLDYLDYNYKIGSRVNGVSGYEKCPRVHKTSVLMKYISYREKKTNCWKQ